MKYVDEFRQADACQRVLERIKQRASRRWTIMEVCGGQTHGLLQFGIDQALQGTVELLHGPGCPVCVTPLELIDLAVELSQRENVLLTSFGDMLRVPGSRESLVAVRARGGRVRAVYSPSDAVDIARRDRQTQVVFFAVGFETTAPATALAVQQAHALGLENFSLLVSHVQVLPAMEMLVASPNHGIDGFLAAGHVCSIAGYEEYVEFTARHQLPVVVTGFEPLDLLAGIEQCVGHLESGDAIVTNAYSRSVTAQGNRQAKQLVESIYEPCDRCWRGLDLVKGGGLRLRPLWRQYDAETRFAPASLPVLECSECRSGEVLAGRIKPTDCEQFGSTCTPESPLGAPMVSSEGACAAYYRFAASQPVKKKETAPCPTSE
jgi:hydrogenase expression/formation protein HypD